MVASRSCGSYKKKICNKLMSSISAKDVLNLSEEALKEKAKVWLNKINYKEQMDKPMNEVNDGECNT